MGKELAVDRHLVVTGSIATGADVDPLVALSSYVGELLEARVQEVGPLVLNRLQLDLIEDFILP